MAHDVFISYATKDRTIADAVCSTLERRGIRCWYAPRDVVGDWGKAIMSAIAGSRIMVLILSGHANDSRVVIDEVVTALNMGLTVIPLRITDGVPTGSMALHLANIHWLDALTSPLEAHLNMLADKVQSSLGEAISSPSLISRPSASKTRRGYVLFGGIVVACLALASVLYFAAIRPAMHRQQTGQQERRSGTTSPAERQSSSDRQAQESETISEADKNLFCVGTLMGTASAKIIFRMKGEFVEMSKEQAFATQGLLTILGFTDAARLTDSLVTIMHSSQSDSAPREMTETFKRFAAVYKPLDDFVAKRYGQRGTMIFKLGAAVTPLRYQIRLLDAADGLRSTGQLPADVSTDGVEYFGQVFQGVFKSVVTLGGLPRDVIQSVNLVGTADLTKKEGRQLAKREVANICAAFGMPMDPGLRTYSLSKTPKSR